MKVDDEVDGVERACFGGDEDFDRLARDRLAMDERPVVVPSSSFGTRRPCARVSSAIGDGFCDAAGGAG